MNHRLATVFALLLVACGVLFLALAALSLRHSPVAQSSRPVAKLPVNSSPSGEGGPFSVAVSAFSCSPALLLSAAPRPSGEGLRPETANSVTSAAPEIIAPAPSSTAAATRPADLSDLAADRLAARRQAAILWVALALPLLFVTFVLIVVLRRLRPPPMKRTGPSDTTDLWQEAGKRLK